jgi:hypothetical protein
MRRGEHRAEWDLERVRRDVEIAAAGRGGVEVDAVGADPDRVLELLGRASAGTSVDADVLLEHGDDAADAPTFADIGAGSESVGGAERAAVEA